MRIICPICKKPGYIVKEKPRKKNVTPTRRGYYKKNKIPYPTTSARNCGWSPHTDYDSSNRIRSEYFRIKHNCKDVIKNTKTGDSTVEWASRPCYIGSPKAILKKIQIIVGKDPQHEFHHRAMEWLPRLEKAIDVILKKKEIVEDDVRFLVNLKRMAKRPNALRKWLESWLNAIKQREEKKAEEHSNSSKIKDQIIYN